MTTEAKISADLATGCRCGAAKAAAAEPAQAPKAAQPAAAEAPQAEPAAHTARSKGCCCSG